MASNSRASAPSSSWVCTPLRRDRVPGGQRLGGLGELVQGAGKKPGDTVRQAGAHHKEDGENLSVGLLLLLAGLIDGGDVVGHIENQGFP